MTKFTSCSLLTLLFITLAVAASASTGVTIFSQTQFDFWGFSIAPHPVAVGDELQIVAAVDQSTTSVPLGLDFSSYEYTVYIYGLVLEAVIPNGPLVEYHYSGGLADIFADPSFNAPFTAQTDPGDVPPLEPAEVPGHFKDGVLLVRYSFTDCVMLFHETFGIGAVAYAATELRAVRGSGLGQLHNMHMTVGWHMGGGYTDDSGAYIPAGYGMRFDTVIKWENPLPVEPVTWGAIKAAYN